jgi:hypothetical protein
MSEVVPFRNRWRRFVIQSAIMMFALMVGYLSSVALKAYNAGGQPAAQPVNAAPDEPPAR